jgi:transcriptional regulator with XRE-family HTH domain
MTRGYSQYTVDLNKSADKRQVGVALGRLCIAKRVPVAQIAERFGVSRQTVYNWFAGVHEPSQELLRPILTYIKTLTK